MVMYSLSLAILGLLVNSITVQGQRHKRIVTEGYSFDKTANQAPTGYSRASSTSMPTPDLPSTDHSTLFQYSPSNTSSATPILSPSAVSAVRNTTSSRSSSSISGTAFKPSTYAPYPSGTASGLPKSSVAPVCGGQTLNVLTASLDWWYAETYTYVASIFTVDFNNNDSITSWSVVAPTTTFDVTSALAAPSCESTIVWDASASVSVYSSACYATPGPVAAATTVITQTAYVDLNATTGTGDLPSVATPPPPAVVTADGVVQSYSAGVPFVFFDAYQIMSKYSTTYQNGSVGCAETTQRVDMAAPFSFEFEGGDVNGSQEVGTGVVGDVNPAFLELFSIDAAAGSWVAKPTVVVVVEKVFGAQGILAGSAAVTATSLLLPSPTLPSFTTPTETMPNDFSTPAASPHIESTRTGGLIAPFQGLPTLAQFLSSAPTPATLPSVVGPQESKSDSAGPTDIGGIAGAIESALNAAPASPTNALEVFSEALISTGIGSVILAGLGAATKASSLPTVITASPDTAGQGSSADIPQIVLGSQTFTANAATQFSLASGEVLTPGGKVVLSGTTVSLATDASMVVIGETTQMLTATGTLNAGLATVTTPPVLYIDGKAYAANAGTSYMIAGQILTPGGAVIMTNGGKTETMSLNNAADELMTIVDGTTLTSRLGAAPTAAPVLTIDGQLFTAMNNGATYVIGGETLTPGEVETVTVSGQTYLVSLSPQATVLQVVGLGANGQATSTMLETLFPAQGGPVTEYMTVGDAATASQGVSASGSSALSTNGPSSQVVNAAESLPASLSKLAVTIALALSVLWL